MRLITLFTVLIAVLLLSSGAPLAVAEDEGGPTITVLGARVQPIKAKDKAWDQDHGAIPFIVYHQVGGITGFPPLTLLSLVPYRNRPDPYVVVEGQGVELARSKSVQGTFAPAWLLEVEVPVGEDAPPLLVFRVLDDDLRTDDAVGKAMVDLAEVLAKPGLHTVEGTSGLHDFSFVVRNPDAEGAGVPQTLTLDRIHVVVKRQRPAGGEWDAGGNPLARRFPKLKIPKELEGLQVVRPDIRVTARFSSGGTAKSDLAADALENDWKSIGLRVKGRTGIGDGLYLDVVDEDLVLADPVGVLYVPFEAFVEHAEAGRLEVEGDELNGVEKVEITYKLAP